MRILLIIILLGFGFLSCNSSNEQTKRFDDMQKKLTAPNYDSTTLKDTTPAIIE